MSAPRNDDIDSGSALDEPDTVAADALLIRVADGDQPAFEQVYRRFSARVYGLAVRILRSTSHAEEVTQEIFLQIWQRAGRFDPTPGSATSWIMTMTHSRCVDRVRSTQASRARDLADGVNSYLPNTDVVSDTVEQNAEHLQVRGCLDGLTELQRSAVTLAYFDGHTYSEVANILQIGLPAIKTRIRDGIIRLRDCMSIAA